MADDLHAGDADKKLFLPSEVCPISPESTRTGSSQGWPKTKAVLNYVEVMISD